MILSIWRYSHLALAVSSSLFVLILAVTGVILALDPIVDKVQPHHSVHEFPDQTLAQTIEVLESRYPEIISLSADANGFLAISTITEEGDLRNFYVHPITGEETGELAEQSKLIQFATNLHRSLFLKSPGRIFIGVSSFLLFLIAVTGLILIVKRQQGIRHLFNKIIRENFLQYGHVYLGRLALLPLVIITLTGVYLSLLRFSIIPDPIASHEVDYATISDTPRLPKTDFPLFARTALSEVRSIEFPFSDDIYDYYQISLRQQEVIINQYTGDVLSSVSYPVVVAISRLSTNLHTGRGSIAWSIILALSSTSILFFMYSGFRMTLKRRRDSRIQNRYSKKECEYIILVGSETGTTMRFARLFHEQLEEAGIKSYVAELNAFERFPKLKQLVVFTATYGEGEAPTNAKKFESLIRSASFKQPFQYAVVGFGSLAYPDFCKYAFDVDSWLAETDQAERLLDTFPINGRSFEAFTKWVGNWNAATGLEVVIPKEDTVIHKGQKTQSIEVVRKTAHNDTFFLELQPDKPGDTQSGDLLAIIPEGESHERLYSLGTTADKQWIISVKRHDQGVCSTYLSGLEPGDVIEAHVVGNAHFHFPRQAKNVLLVSSGTGIAPFLGMLNEHTSKAEVHLYWGGKTRKSFGLYEPWIAKGRDNGRLHHFHTAYSREEERKHYVQDLIQRDAVEVARLLHEGGVVMICGSIAMQTGVTEVLNTICLEHNQQPLSFYRNRDQLKMDCY